MQINGLYGTSVTPETPLTEGQKTLLEELTSKYDPENMSAEDRRDLRDELVEAGIPRSGEAMKILREAGFAMRPAGEETAKQTGSASQGLKKGELLDLYRQFQAGEISEAEFRELTAGNVAVGSLFSCTS